MTEIVPAPRCALEEELLNDEYRIEPETFWTLSVLRGDDGYDRMEPAGANRWRPIPSWGRDGWDLGCWPLAVIYHRATLDAWQLAYNVEGDITVYSYPQQQQRDAATDCIAFWHWKHDECDWVDGIDSAESAPYYLHGPFSGNRMGQ
jgi:hypothetical protein